MGDLKMEKNHIRKCMIDKRASLSLEEVKQKSLIIIDKLANLDEFNNSKWIMIYIDFRNEVCTRGLIERCFLEGKKVAVPYVFKGIDNKRELWACEIKDMNTDLQIGTFGILEPKNNATSRIDPVKLDMIIVPGTVFDTKKQRIGYGAGFYDGFLKKISKECLKVGIAFELQITDKAPCEHHDIPMDLIITEDRII